VKSVLTSFVGMASWKLPNEFTLDNKEIHLRCYKWANDFVAFEMFLTMVKCWKIDVGRALHPRFHRWNNRSSWSMLKQQPLFQWYWFQIPVYYHEALSIELYCWNSRLSQAVADTPQDETISSSKPVKLPSVRTYTRHWVHAISDQA
jgi:hypothetical protein